MKHGPIALIDEQLPVVAIAPHDAVFEKMLGNIQEAKARGGVIIAIATQGRRPPRPHPGSAEGLEDLVAGGAAAGLAGRYRDPAPAPGVPHRRPARL